MGGRDAEQEFRDVMALFPAGVTVMSTWAGDQPYATTTTAFASLSADPMLVMAALGSESRLLEHVRTAGRVGISYLNADQRSVAEQLAQTVGKSIDLSDWEQLEGLPVLAGARAFVATTLQRLITAGDHELLICSVDSALKLDHASPALVYHGREYHAV